MRPASLRLPLTPFVFLLTTGFLPLGCVNSDSVTGPSMNAAAVNLNGTWSGKYLSNDPGGCGGSTASAEFHQEGATVTGKVSTSTCGVAGTFNGTVQGSVVTGVVAMAGCLGGGASGTLAGSELVLSIGDLTKPLVTGDQVIMYGGVITFHR